MSEASKRFSKGKYVSKIDYYVLERLIRASE